MKPEQLYRLVYWQFWDDQIQSNHEGETLYQEERIEGASSPKGPTSSLYISYDLKERGVPSFPEYRAKQEQSKYNADTVED